MSAVLEFLAKSVHDEIVKLSRSHDWSLRDVIPLILACDRLFDATLVAICLAESSRGRMKDYFDAMHRDRHWSFLCPMFISQPIAEGKVRSLPVATRTAIQSLLMRSELDQSKNSEGENLYEIKTALLVRRHLPDFFESAADRVSNTELSAAFRAFAERFGKTQAKVEQIANADE